MKIRNGFVSNSSASSFIVPHINDYFKKSKSKLDSITIKKLLKFGFKETRLGHPSHLDSVQDTDQTIWHPLVDKKTKKILIKNYGYWVSCNESEVIRFLVKNNIGFIATGHYGHVTYLFHKGDKHVMVFTNYGAEVETYHYDKKWEEIIKRWKDYKQEPFYRIPIKNAIREDI